jgi:hypothetical protein
MANMVDEAFSDPSEASYRSEYILELRDNWRHVIATHTRDVVLIVLLVAIFELTARSAVTKVSIGPFEVSNIPIVFRVLPLLIAYLLYDMAILDKWHMLMESAHAHLMRVMHPKVRSTDFDWLLVPTVHPLSNTLIPSNSRFAKVANIILVVAFLGGVIAFEIRAVYILFQTFGAQDLLVWISSAFIAILLVSALGIFAEGAGEARRR